MKHLRRLLGAIAIVVAADIPLVAGDPSVRHYIAAHPAVAAYLPLAIGLIRVAYKALVERKTGAPAAPAPAPAAAAPAPAPPPPPAA